MATQYWNPKDAAALSRVVDRLATTRGATGWSMGVPFCADLSALRRLVQLPRTRPQSDIYSMKAITRMVKDGESGLEQFAKALAAELREERERHAIDQGACWFLLPIRLPRGIGQIFAQSIRVLGRTFGFMQIDDLHEYLGSLGNEWDTNTREMLAAAALPRTFACVCGTGFPLEHAFDEITPAFDALRGAMELCLSEGTMYMSSHGWSRQGQICHPEHLICVREGRPTVTLRFLAPKWTPAQTLQNQDNVGQLLDRTREYVAHLPEHAPDTSTASLLGDVLRLYGQAMEEERAHAGLLSFWQIAEAVTLDANDRGAGDKVVARLSTLEPFATGHKDGTLRYALEGIMHKRNEAVHRGRLELVDEDDVNLLKRVTEVAIRWLFSHRSDLPTRETLRQWWYMAGQSDKNLEMVSKVAEAVSTERERLK